MSNYNSNSSWQSASSSNNNSTSSNPNLAVNPNPLFNNPASLLFNLNNLATTIPNLQALVPNLLQQTVNSAAVVNNQSSSWTSTSSTNRNNSNSRSSSSSNKNEPRPLMEIDTLKTNQTTSSSNSSRSGNNNNRNNSSTGPVSTNNNNTNNLNSIMNQNPLVAQVLNQLTGIQPSTNLINAFASTLVNSAAVATNNNNSNNNKDTRSTRDNRSSSTRRSMTHRSSRSPSSHRHNSNNNNGNKKRTLSKSPTNSSHKRSSNYTSSSSSSNNNNANNSSSNSTNNNNNNSNNKTTSSTSNANSSNVKSSNTTSSSSSSKYTIKLPKYQLNNESNNVSILKNRSQELYIPSDFSNSKNSYLNCLPLNRPLKFHQRCLFHIMRKEAKPVTENKAIFDPPDSDHAWTVKVMLMAMPNMEELYKRSCELAENFHLNDRYEHPSKVIQFLVGNKGGKHELMALGGAWSKSLDGPNPESNNQTLINTAVRTVKALTGIDLSPCTQWYRFLDIQYNRNEEYKAVSKTSSNLAGEPSSNDNENLPCVTFNDDSDVDTTVIFVPNVWSLTPNTLEYQKIVEAYKNLIDSDDVITIDDSSSKISSNSNSNLTNGHSKQDENDHEGGLLKPSISSTVATSSSTTNLPSATPSKANGVSGELDVTLNSDSETSNITINSLMQQSQTEIKPEPTHYSKIDLKKIRVDELRSELMARNLETKGLKAQLLQRLKDALDEEKEKDEKLNQIEIQDNEIELSINSESQSDMKDDELLITPHNDIPLSATNDETTKTNQSATKTSQNEQKQQHQSESTTKLSRHEREKLYKLPLNPHIIVHPATISKYPKFDCQLVSLSHLLDYRREDNKESSFEVSLFAECFNDMLMRDHSFTIFKHILSLKDQEKNAKKSTTNDSSSSNTNESSSQSKPKPKTIYPELLLAFTYFDTNRTNYIYYKDLEDIFISILGLNLTRSKIKYIFEMKLNFKDHLLNYRHLTDSNQKYEIGFKLPNDNEIVSHLLSFDLYMKRITISNGDSAKNNNSTEGLVEINGTTYDVLNTIKKLEKSELNLVDLDTKLKESLSEMERLKIINKNMERQKQKAQDEIETLKKKLREQERMNRDTYDKYSRFKECVYRSKSQLGKFLDDINDVIKRGQLTSSSNSLTSSNSANNVAVGVNGNENENKNVEKIDNSTESKQEDEQTKGADTEEAVKMNEESSQDVNAVDEKNEN